MVVGTWLSKLPEPCPHYFRSTKPRATPGPLLWKFRTSPGNGVTNRYFVCNAHKYCGRLLKVGKKDGMFCIFLDGKHSAEPSFGKRKNSTLSWDDDDRLKRAVDQGATPGGVHVSLSKAKVMELQQDGLDPLEYKNDQGGFVSLVFLGLLPMFGSIEIPARGEIPCFAQTMCRSKEFGTHPAQMTHNRVACFGSADCFLVLFQ